MEITNGIRPVHITFYSIRFQEKIAKEINGCVLVIIFYFSYINIISLLFADQNFPEVYHTKHRFHQQQKQFSKGKNNVSVARNGTLPSGVSFIRYDYC